MTRDFSSVSVAPGESIGILTSNNIFWDNFVTYRVEIDGPVPDTGHDQLVVRGSVTLEGARLIVTNIATPPAGSVLTIIDNIFRPSRDSLTASA